MALKVDCDTYEGTKKGLPNLLDLFEKAGIRASFYFTLGPDNSGRAITRVFTQKGFLKKMLRSKAVSLYGPKTMMYGTLLPTPMIGQKLKDVIRSVGQAAHETGVHAWDHIRWHDKLDRMSAVEIDRDYNRAHSVFTEIFGEQAKASAAPGWHVTPTYLAIQERYKLLYASNTRGGRPFFPMDKEKVFETLEIPSTLPTWDEALADPAIKGEEDLLHFYQNAIKGTQIHSIHTEVEGTAHLELFRKQIALWKSDGVEFVTLDQVAREILRDRSLVPTRPLTRISIPNRGGLVSSGYPELGIAS